MCVQQILQDHTIILILAVTNDEKDCIKLFYCPDVNATRLSIPPRVNGTFTWFTELSTFKQWLMPEGPAILFLSSNPGCGKTVLCSYLIKCVKLLKPCHTVCYFFCNDSVASQRSVTHILRGFLHQLLVSHNFLVKYVLPHLETKGLAMLDELDTMMTIFGDCSMDPHLPDVVFILDALDECEVGGRALLIKWLKRHFAYLPGKSENIKFLLTSRPEIGITDILDDTAVSRISLQDTAPAKNLKRDIGLVIRSRIESMPSLRTLAAHKKRQLRAKLSRNADRTFLWISLVLNSLEESFSTNYEEILAEIPATLEETYIKILSSIPYKHRADTKAILEILVASRRPMSLEELNVCWSLTEAHTSLNDVTAELCTDMARVVSQLCGQFVRISENRLCYLVHQTAKEFLLSSSLPRTFLAKEIYKEIYWYRVTANEAAQNMATKCIRILILRDREDHNNRVALPNDLSNALVQSQGYLYQDYLYSKLPLHEDEPSNAMDASCIAFSEYAFRWWAFHFRELEQHNKGDSLEEAALSALVVTLYRNIASVRIHWYRKMLHLAGTDMECGETVHRVPPAILCAYNGHISVMPSLLESPTAVNYHRSLLDFSLLHVTVLGNQEAMVGWLLNHHANTEVRDVFKRTPLHLAARRNSPAVLQLLLSHGANKYARDSSNKTPLHGAQELCIQENIRLLEDGESNASPDLLAMELDDMAAEVDMKSVIPATESKTRPLNHAIQIRSMLASMTLDFPAVSQLQVEEVSVVSHARTLTDSLVRSEGSMHSSLSSDERKVLSIQNMSQIAPISSADFLSDSGSSIGSAMSLHSRQGSMTEVVSLPTPESKTRKRKYFPGERTKVSQRPTQSEIVQDVALSTSPAWRTRYFENIIAQKTPKDKVDTWDKTLYRNGITRIEYEHDCRHCGAKFYASQLLYSVLFDQYEYFNRDGLGIPSCEPCWERYQAKRKANPSTYKESRNEEFFVENLSGDCSHTDYSSASELMEPISLRTVPNPSERTNPYMPPPPQSMIASFNSRFSSDTQKKYKCKVCNKSFRRPSSLQTHMYTHMYSHSGEEQM